MLEVTGAIIAIELVLVSVFVPIAFLGGIAGQLYKQFAITVATSVTISGVVALTLTPALCALLLKRAHQESMLFRPFNRGFAWLTALYSGAVRWSLRHVLVSLLLFAAVLGPSSGCCARCPPASCLPKTRAMCLAPSCCPTGRRSAHQKGADTVQQLLVKHPAVEHVFMITGFDLISGGPKTSSATTFVALKQWEQRTATADQMVGYLFGAAASIREAW